MSRYTGEARITLNGDRALAARYVAEGRKYLGGLMVTHPQQTAVRELTNPDGVHFRVGYFAGVPFIQITAGANPSEKYGLEVMRGFSYAPMASGSYFAYSENPSVVVTYKSGNDTEWKTFFHTSPSSLTPTSHPTDAFDESIATYANIAKSLSSDAYANRSSLASPRLMSWNNLEEDLWLHWLGAWYFNSVRPSSGSLFHNGKLLLTLSSYLPLSASICGAAAKRTQSGLDILLCVTQSNGELSVCSIKAVPTDDEKRRLDAMAKSEKSKLRSYAAEFVVDPASFVKHAGFAVGTIAQMSAFPFNQDATECRGFLAVNASPNVNVTEHVLNCEDLSEIVKTVNSSVSVNCKSINRTTLSPNSYVVGRNDLEWGFNPVLGTNALVPVYGPQHVVWLWREVATEVVCTPESILFAVDYIDNVPAYLSVKLRQSELVDRVDFGTYSYSNTETPRYFFNGSYNMTGTFTETQNSTSYGLTAYDENGVPWFSLEGFSTREAVGTKAASASWSYKLQSGNVTLFTGSKNLVHSRPKEDDVSISRSLDLYHLNLRTKSIAYRERVVTTKQEYIENWDFTSPVWTGTYYEIEATKQLTSGSIVTATQRTVVCMCGNTVFDSGEVQAQDPTDTITTTTSAPFPVASGGWFPGLDIKQQAARLVREVNFEANRSSFKDSAPFSTPKYPYSDVTSDYYSRINPSVDAWIVANYGVATSYVADLSFSDFASYSEAPGTLSGNVPNLSPVASPSYAGSSSYNFGFASAGAAYIVNASYYAFNSTSAPLHMASNASIGPKGTLDYMSGAHGATHFMSPFQVSAIAMKVIKQ